MAPYYLPEVIWWHLQPGDTSRIPGDPGGLVGPHQIQSLQSKHTQLHGIGCRVVGERLGSLEPIPRMLTVLHAGTVTTVTNKRKPQSSGCTRRGSCGLWA